MYCPGTLEKCDIPTSSGFPITEDQFTCFKDSLIDEDEVCDGYQSLDDWYIEHCDDGGVSYPFEEVPPCDKRDPGTNHLQGCGFTGPFVFALATERGNAPEGPYATAPVPDVFVAMNLTDTQVCGNNFYECDDAPSPCYKCVDDGFSMRWQGNFTFNKGAYKFHIDDPNDGFRLFIDNVQISPENEWDYQSGHAHSYVYNMSAGLHLIRLEFFEGTGGNRMYFWWERVVQPAIWVHPAGMVFQSISPNPATPSSNTLSIYNTGQATLNWTAQTNQSWCRINGVNNSGSLTGSLAPDAGTSVTVTVDTITAPGDNNCFITVSDPAAVNSPQYSYVSYKVIPGDPSDLKASGNCNQINLTWTAGSAATSYNIYRAFFPSPTPDFNFPYATGVTGTSWQDPTPNPVSPAYYWIASVGGTKTLIAADTNSSGGIQPVATCPAPTVTLKINAQDSVTVPSGSTATLTWTSTDATSCSASSSAGDWSGSKAVNNSIGELTGSITTDRTYTLTCTGPGGSANDTVSVNVSSANQPPVAAASISKDGGPFSGSITVTQGVPVAVALSAAGSDDPDGWASSNGVSDASGLTDDGRCEWNSDLNQGAPTYETTILNPASPADCNISLGTLTFSDAPGTYTYQVLRITDRPGATSNIASVSVTVISVSGPSCTSAGPDGWVTTQTTGTADFFAYGAANSANVNFAVWSEINGQDDLVWYPGVDQGGGTWKATVDMAAHRPGSPDYGQFRVHVWLHDYNVFCDTADFVRNQNLPNPPSNLQADNSTCSQIRLTWTDNSTNETGFHVWRDVGPSIDGTTISYSGVTYYKRANLGADVTSYIDTPPTGAAYRYAVTSYNADGDSTISAQNAVGPVFNNPCVASLILSNKFIDQVNGVPYNPGQTLRAGHTVTFKIIINNSGSATAYDLYIRDTLTNTLDYTEGSVRLNGSAISESVAGQIVTWNASQNLGDKEKDGSNWILTFDAKLVSSSTSAIDFFRNTATIYYSNSNGGSRDQQVTVRTPLTPFLTGRGQVPIIKEIAP